MSSSETEPIGSTDAWLREVLLDAVADHPPVTVVVSLLLDASVAMEASGDVRWRRVGEYLGEQADLIATPDPFMPHSQMSTDWLARNHRALLEMARTFLGEQAGTVRTPGRRTRTRPDQRGAEPR